MVDEESKWLLFASGLIGSATHEAFSVWSRHRRGGKFPGYYDKPSFRVARVVLAFGAAWLATSFRRIDRLIAFEIGFAGLMIFERLQGVIPENVKQDL